jgi:hypothetical protein
MKYVTNTKISQPIDSDFLRESDFNGFAFSTIDGIFLPVDEELLPFALPAFESDFTEIQED